MRSTKVMRQFDTPLRRIRFYKDRVEVGIHCAICARNGEDGWACNDFNSRTRDEVREILANDQGRVVYVGCQSFRGDVVAYARRWAK